MIVHPRKAALRKSRRGMLSMELVLSLPLMLLVLLAVIEFSLLLYARGDVVQASRAGARLAALHGVDADDVQREVSRVLAGRFPANISVQAQVGEFSGDEVIVAVRVPMAAAAPNLLWAFGYNLRGRQLIAETRMIKE